MQKFTVKLYNVEPPYKSNLVLLNRLRETRVVIFIICHDPQVSLWRPWSSCLVLLTILADVSVALALLLTWSLRRQTFFKSGFIFCWQLYHHVGNLELVTQVWVGPTLSSITHPLHPCSIAWQPASITLPCLIWRALHLSSLDNMVMSFEKDLTTCLFSQIRLLVSCTLIKKLKISSTERMGCMSHHYGCPYFQCNRVGHLEHLTPLRHGSYVLIELQNNYWKLTLCNEIISPGN